MVNRTIDIERNIVERFLMRIKESSKGRKKQILLVIGILFLCAILAITGIVFYNTKANNELTEFEKILDQYYMSSEKDSILENTVNGLNKIINKSLWGYVNENGNYIVAGVLLSAEKYTEGKDYLLKYVEKSPSSFFAPLALHKAAIIYEKLDDTENAYKLYSRLEKEYKDSVIIDEVYYNLGRLFQIKGDFLKAKEYYNKIISEFPMSMFSAKAKNRLFLLTYNKEANPNLIK
jgi:tetratricopeptide (TPR) repeat protein